MGRDAPATRTGAGRRARPDDFADRVLVVVRRIPAGRVATYGDVAALAGAPRAARAVGNVMRGCRDATVPCHRVVAAGGLLGGYGGFEAMKRALLSAEGVLVVGRRIRGFAGRRWAPARPRRA